ncbi:hypothetical protein [Caballeronia sp. M23-90]
MDTPIVEKIVALVEFPHERAEPRTQRCPALDCPDERLTAHMSRWHRELTELNDTSRLGGRDATQQPEHQHQVARRLALRAPAASGE